jgi:hypothetical protein
MHQLSETRLDGSTRSPAGTACGYKPVSQHRALPGHDCSDTELYEVIGGYTKIPITPYNFQ